MKKLNRGFSLLEVLTVVTIGAFLALGVAKAGQWVSYNSKILQLQSDINTLRSGVQQWQFSGGSPATLSIATLTANAMLPEEWGDGSSYNPWRGDYEVSPDLMSINRYTVSINQIDAELIGSRVVQYYGDAVASHTASSGVLEITFK